jgi:dTDP-4-amino-4,6-dideoxygalactose transaminase
MMITETTIRIPFLDLNAQYQSIKKDIDEAIAQVIAESAFIRGRFVQQFEQEFGKLYGVKHVIGCGNGTDSLYIIMKMLGIGHGDEVITAANSWISSSETITQAGAKPVFVDVHPEFYSMDESILEKSITTKTRAVIAVHLQGQMCEIDRIAAICKKNNIQLIEDCAQAHFAEFKEIRAGLRGIAGSFSFYPGKNLGAYGDAGCIITQDDDLAEKCRMYANHGSIKKHDHKMEGINSRLDGLQAAILSAKLPYILDWTAKRISVASWYQKYLDKIPGIVLPRQRPNSKHTYHLYVIRAKNRDGLKKYLEENLIETQIHYPGALPYLPAYKWLNYTPEDFPVALGLQGEILSLPIFPEMREEMVQHVTSNIRAFYKQ